jgi:hypothetical protein
MALKEKIHEDLKEAMKGKEELTSSVLRMLIAAIITKEKEKRYKIGKGKPEMTEVELIEESQLTEEEVVDVLVSEVKKRKESILSFEQGGRPELAEKEKKEAQILYKYLPEQMSEEELKKLVAQAVQKTGAKEQKDMGRVMAELMPKIKGKADSGLVSKIVKDILLSQA